MMNGLDKIRVVVDTNIYFMAFYNPESKAGRLILAALENKINLFSPNYVRSELKRTLMRKFKISTEMIDFLVESLPIIWVNEEYYINILKEVKIKSKEDAPILATALVLNCGLITVDKRFAKQSKKFVKVWDIDELLEETEKR